MPNPVVHFEAMGLDGPALQKFYAEAFEWKINGDNDMNYGLVDNGGEGINGGIGQGTPEGGGNHLTFYIWVPDLDAALKHIESLGGKTINPPMEVPGGPKLAHFEDPAGNFVGLLTGSAEEMGMNSQS